MTDTMKDDKSRLTPAALAAAARGDMANAVRAMTPGGIEAQEAQGQRDFVESTTLPKEINYPRGLTQEEVTDGIGIEFGEDADDLFVNVTLPEGWRKEATEHSMWSKLLDDKGRERAQMFYKAAFYDRSAHISFTRYLNIRTKYVDDEGNEVDYPDHTQRLFYVENAEGEVLFTPDPVPAKDWDAHSEASKECEQWLYDNYPEFDSPFVYW